MNKLTGYFILIAGGLIGIYVGKFINLISFRRAKNQSVSNIFTGLIRNKISLSSKEIEDGEVKLFAKDNAKRTNRFIRLNPESVEIACSCIVMISSLYTENDIYRDPQYIRILESWIISSILIFFTIIDLKYFWVPETAFRFAFSLAIVRNFFYSINTNFLKTITALSNYLVASLLGYVSFLIIAYIAKHIIGKKALGEGDIKLSALLGMLLGLKGWLITISLSFLLSFIIVLTLMVIGKLKIGEYIPFAPFLCLSAFLVWFTNNEYWINGIYSFNSIW
ncbi:A24 family peptidase [Prochlorococcus sp. MIT 1223]|uniref:A24 family peptidase n=1 Tax=Prochlorococcus sp. MIT 1223 TaxID=3096217 RepID=UPI002A758695|nr:A24 family peptidase [Prochlorococcus sp. MIT 1223]